MEWIGVPGTSRGGGRSSISYLGDNDVDEEAEAAGTTDRELVLGWVFGVLVVAAAAAAVALVVAGSREDVSLSTTDLWREVAAAVLLDAMDYAMGQAGAQEARRDSDDCVATTAGGR